MLDKINLSKYKNYNNFYVGLSGGPDSMLLAFLLRKKYKNKTITCIHVNHNLSPKAKEWEKVCQTFCENNNINFVCENVVFKKFSENAGRIARLKIFKKYTDTIFLGHNHNDNIETFLFRIFSNRNFNKIMKSETVVDGLHIVRPLINVTKEKILFYCEKNKLNPVVDDSNSDIRYTRNFIRHRIVSECKEYFGERAFYNRMLNMFEKF